MCARFGECDLDLLRDRWCGGLGGRSLGAGALGATRGFRVFFGVYVSRQSSGVAVRVGLADTMGIKKSRGKAVSYCGSHFAVGRRGRITGNLALRRNEPMCDGECGRSVWYNPHGWVLSVVIRVGGLASTYKKVSIPRQLGTLPMTAHLACSSAPCDHCRYGLRLYVALCRKDTTYGGDTGVLNMEQYAHVLDVATFGVSVCDCVGLVREGLLLRGRSEPLSQPGKKLSATGRLLRFGDRCCDLGRVSLSDKGRSSLSLSSEEAVLLLIDRLLRLGDRFADLARFCTCLSRPDRGRLSPLLSSVLPLSSGVSISPLVGFCELDGGGAVAGRESVWDACGDVPEDGEIAVLSASSSLDSSPSSQSQSLDSSPSSSLVASVVVLFPTLLSSASSEDDSFWDELCSAEECPSRNSLSASLGFGRIARPDDVVVVGAHVPPCIISLGCSY